MFVLLFAVCLSGVAQNPSLVTDIDPSTDVGDVLFGAMAGGMAPNMRYMLREDIHVLLEVHDAIGRRVCTLIDEERVSGTHTVRFGPGMLPAGLCYGWLRTADGTHTIKMIWTR